MTCLSRRGFLVAGGGIGAALSLASCGLTGRPAPGGSASTKTTKSSTTTQSVRALDADYLYAQSGGARMLVGDGKQCATRLVTPHFGSVLREFGATDHLDSSAATMLRLPAAPGGYQAAPDHEILFAQFAAGAPPYIKKDAASYAFLIDGVSRPVSAPFGDWNLTLRSYDKFWACYVLSVPKGKPVLFTVSDSGKTAKLDLRTGAPVRDADTEACAVYQQPWTVNVPTKYAQQIAFTTDPPPGYRSDAGNLELDYEVGTTGLEPWSPDTGWVSAGRALLAVTVTVTAPLASGPNMTFNPKDIFSVTVNGQRVACGLDKQVDVLRDCMITPGGAVLECSFDVPADMTGAEFTIDNRTPVTMQYQDGAVPTHDNSRTPPATFKVAKKL